MKTYDLYGVDAKNLDTARNLVERLLEIRMFAHESGYHCGSYYRLGDVGTEHFILQRNHDTFENEWTESDFKEKIFLLYINETSRSEEIAAALLADRAFARLRHQEL